ncbi:MAG: Tat pathway signal protein [Planctomycetes bacterium GWC2_45_44]|nr:MAG: Tat pathway signal protein [Planctomycetes bacterium GWC2_45_44]
MRITGTFLDEITFDIPSNNWGTAQWDMDFAAMKRIGIDTVIIIRSGLNRQAIFNSKAISKKVKLLPVHSDLAQMFLELAEKHKMKLFFGTYDSNIFWRDGRLQDEVDINLELVDEIWQKYGKCSAFAGWYMAHEFGRLYGDVPKSLKKVADRCKAVSGGLPVIMSPYMWGKKAVGEDAIDIEQHRKEWNDILSILHKSVDIVAFQDGHVDYNELKDYICVNKQLINKYQMTAWSNVESFDRDMPFNFPPIDWRKMQWKLDFAAQAGVDKCITFEFSHFMSPYSTWPSARNLFFRYCEHFGIDIKELCD